MARVFASQELVSRIARGLIGHLYPRDDFIYVQALSQVCRATRGPALDFWWHTQYSLYYVLRALGDAVEYTIRTPGRRHIGLARPIQDAEWYQFRYYASKIKRLSSRADRTVHGPEPRAPSFDIDKTLLNALLARGLPLLPSLERLVWPQEGIEESFDPNLALALFVTPRLKSFRAIGEEDSQVAFADAVMACLSDKRPPLDTFCLVDEYEKNWDECAIILNTVQNTVRILEYSNVPEDDLHRLAGLPHLERVLIPLYNMCESDVDVFFQKVGGITTHPFSLLKALTLRCDGVLSVASHFLRSWHWDAALEEILIDLPNPADDDSIDGPSLSQLIHALTQLPHLAHLHTVRISGPRASTRWVEEALVGPASLLPLLGFAHLQHVALSVEACFDLDDWFVADAARAWPRLRTLDLGCAGRWPVGRKPGISLGSLARLAHWCVYLEVLRIRVNALDWPRGEFYRKGVARCWALRELDVGSSPIGVNMVTKVSTYLLDIFPLMTSLGTDTNDIDEENIARWRVSNEGNEAFPMLWRAVWAYISTGQLHRFNTLEYEYIREDVMKSVRRHFPNGRPHLLEFVAV
ncbi:hypothetical protein EIP86_008233 [Pleurotus ostreatoroseus]|nr:hypothetical protein EIP86_008233 [Pleurotus ostreatoroseus]